MVTRAKKEETVASLSTALGKAQAAIISDYRGLSVKEITTLRRRLQKANGDYIVAKNTLIQLALKDHPGFAGMSDLLKGPTAIAIGYDDPVSPSKAVMDFIKETKGKISVRGGIIDGKTMNEAQVKAIADLPTREVLLARLMGSMKAPISNLVFVLDAIRRQKEEAS